MRSIDLWPKINTLKLIAIIVCQKVPKSDFQSKFSILYKNHQKPLRFFSIKNNSLEAQFLLKIFFDNFKF